MNHSALTFSLVFSAAMAGLFLASCGVQEVPTEGDRSVYAAASVGEFSYVSQFLNGGFDVNTPDADGRTLVHHAAASNQIAVLEVLFEEFHANGRIKDNAGKTALDYAREFDAVDAIWYLEEDQGL